MKNHNLFLTPNYRYRLPESNLKKLILSLIVLLSFVHVAAQNNINMAVIYDLTLSPVAITFGYKKCSQQG